MCNQLIFSFLIPFCVSLLLPLKQITVHFVIESDLKSLSNSFVVQKSEMGLAELKSGFQWAIFLSGDSMGRQSVAHPV